MKKMPQFKNRFCLFSSKTLDTVTGGLLLHLALDKEQQGE